MMQFSAQEMNLIIVNGIPELRTKSSAIFLYLSTPKRFMILKNAYHNRLRTKVNSV